MKKTTSYKKLLLIPVTALFLLSGCTQESQNEFGRAVQNWTGTNGVLDVYTGGKLVNRFLKVDKLSTGVGRKDNQRRAYRYGYGYFDANFNMVVDKGEKKVYFEIGDYNNYVFYENPQG